MTCLSEVRPRRKKLGHWGVSLLAPSYFNSLLPVMSAACSSTTVRLTAGPRQKELTDRGLEPPNHEPK